MRGLMWLAAENDSPEVEPLDGLFVQMPKRLAEGMRELAKANGHTIQQEVRAALREHVERHGRGGASDTAG